MSACHGVSVLAPVCSYIRGHGRGERCDVAAVVVAIRLHRGINTYKIKYL